MSFKNISLKNIMTEDCSHLSEAVTVIGVVNPDIQCVSKSHSVPGLAVPVVEISRSSRRSRPGSKLPDQGARGLHETVFPVAQAGIHTGAKALIQDLSRTLIR
ncbi:hypothetical protein H4S14_000122 [Agrobacterium vitis]|nr:hypothetical protein [Agrobacterium vitis]MBE1436395.1 hypothetical protein [Agrobacterium vitis]